MASSIVSPPTACTGIETAVTTSRKRSRALGTASPRLARSVHVIADVVNDVVATQLLQSFCSLYRIGHPHVIAHNLCTKIPTGLYRQLDGFGMRLAHNYHHAGTRFRH